MTKDAMRLLDGTKLLAEWGTDKGEKSARCNLTPTCRKIETNGVQSEETYFTWCEAINNIIICWLLWHCVYATRLADSLGSRFWKKKLSGRHWWCVAVEWINAFDWPWPTLYLPSSSSFTGPFHQQSTKHFIIKTSINIPAYPRLIKSEMEKKIQK